MAVPLIDLSQQHAALETQLRDVFAKVLSSGRFILGPYVEEFEKKLAAYCTSQFAIAISSGTDALLAALMALDIQPGDEVITTPFTFFATAGSIARVGAKPVFVDIDPTTYNINPKLIEAAITDRTRAIMPVHLFGLSAQMQDILKIARKHSLYVIEDACQAVGAKDGDQQVGTMGDIGCLSFYPTKNLAALGDAGACLAQTPDLAKKLSVIRGHGQTSEYQHDFIGANFRLDGLQTAFLSVKIAHLAKYTEARRAAAARYDQLLAGLPITLPKAGSGKYHVYNQYTLRVPGGKRDALKAHLASRSIGHRVYYPLCLHMQPCFSYLNVKQGSLPESERAAREVLSLPMFPELKADQQAEVAQAIREFYK